MEKTDFTKNNYEVVNFYNIDSVEFRGMWGGEEYVIAPKERKQFVKFLSEHFAKQLAIKILMRNGQEWGDESPTLKDTMGQILGSVEPVKAPTKEPMPIEPKETEDIPATEEFPDVPKEAESEKEFVCETCGKSFGRAAALGTHKRVHK